MARVSDVADADAGQDLAAQREMNLTGSLAVAVLVGVALAVTARIGATALLVALAAVQALLGQVNDSAAIMRNAEGEEIELRVKAKVATDPDARTALVGFVNGDTW